MVNQMRKLRLPVLGEGVSGWAGSGLHKPDQDNLEEDLEADIEYSGSSVGKEGEEREE